MEPFTIAMMLGGAAVKAGAAGMGQRPLDTQAITPGQIRGYMAPVQGTINQMQGSYGQMTGYGQDLMDPTSAINQQQRGMMQQQGANQMALQSILQNRQRAAMGGGGGSGMVQAQQRAQQQQLSQSLGQQYQNQMMQNRTQGLGILGNQQSLLGNIGRMQMGVQENIAQSAIAQTEWQRAEELRKRQAQQAMVGAIGGGMSSLGSGMMEYDIAGLNPPD
jgi:hypothetical protein